MSIWLACMLIRGVSLAIDCIDPVHWVLYKDMHIMDESNGSASVHTLR